MALDRVFHWARIAAPGRGFVALAKEIETTTLPAVEAAGGVRWMLATGLFGLWNHEVILVTHWPTDVSPAQVIHENVPGIVAEVVDYQFVPTARPESREPPSRPGVYVHRLFGVDTANVDRFVELSQEAWKSFESAADYESQPQGLFRQRELRGAGGLMLLVTWYDRLESWERSRTPPSEAAANFQERARLTTRSIAYATRLIGTNPGARGMGAG